MLANSMRSRNAAILAYLILASATVIVGWLAFNLSSVHPGTGRVLAWFALGYGLMTAAAILPLVLDRRMTRRNVWGMLVPNALFIAVVGLDVGWLRAAHQGMLALSGGVILFFVNFAVQYALAGPPRLDDPDA